MSAREQWLVRGLTVALIAAAWYASRDVARALVVAGGAIALFLLLTKGEYASALVAGWKNLRRDVEPQSLPRPVRANVFAFAADLYRRDAMFRIVADWAGLGIVAIAVLPLLLSSAPLTLGQRIEQEMDAAIAAQRAAPPPARPIQSGPYNTSVRARDRDQLIRIDRSLFAKSPPLIQDQLRLAADAFEAERASRVLDLLHGADRGDTNVMLLRGMATISFGGADNIAAGMQLLKQASDGGQRQAMSVLGRLLVSGPIGVNRDPAAGIKLVERAADLGDIPAARYLGQVHSVGLGGPPDLGKAVHYLRIAADGGDAEAAFRLGSHALQGLGMPKDEQEAVRRLLQAAERGHVMAASVLGHVYVTHFQSGWTTDLAPAVKWLSRAADADEVRALHRLAIVHIDIAKDLPHRDPARGAALLKRCADLWHPPCHFGYAHMLETGTGIERSFVLAHAHFSTALGLGRTQAKARLASLEERMSASELDEAKKTAARMATRRP